MYYYYTFIEFMRYLPLLFNDVLLCSLSAMLISVALLLYLGFGLTSIILSSFIHNEDVRTHLKTW